MASSCSCAAAPRCAPHQRVVLGERRRRDLVAHAAELEREFRVAARLRRATSPRALEGRLGDRRAAPRRRDRPPRRSSATTPTTRCPAASRPRSRCSTRAARASSSRSIHHRDQARLYAKQVARRRAASSSSRPRSRRRCGSRSPARSGDAPSEAPDARRLPRARRARSPRRRCSRASGADDAELVPLADDPRRRRSRSHDGDVDRALVPIENSLEGSVNATLDALALETDGRRDRRRAGPAGPHCLIARAPLALDGSRRVLSHPQALAQCAHFLRDALPRAQVRAAHLDRRGGADASPRRTTRGRARQPRSPPSSTARRAARRSRRRPRQRDALRLARARAATRPSSRAPTRPWKTLDRLLGRRRRARRAGSCAACRNSPPRRQPTRIESRPAQAAASATTSSSSTSTAAPTSRPRRRRDRRRCAAHCEELRVLGSLPAQRGDGVPTRAPGESAGRRYTSAQSADGHGYVPPAPAGSAPATGHRPRGRESGRVLVLNATFEPINVCTVRRAVVLLLKEKAEVLEHGEVAAALRQHPRAAAGRDPPRHLRAVPRDTHRRKITRRAVFARETFTVKLQVAVLADASVAVQVTVVVPTGKDYLEGGLQTDSHTRTIIRRRSSEGNHTQGSLIVAVLAVFVCRTSNRRRLRVIDRNGESATRSCGGDTRNGSRSYREERTGCGRAGDGAAVPRACWGRIVDDRAALVGSF